MANDTFINVFTLPSQALLDSFTSALMAIPKIITALLVLLLGWVVAKLSEIVVRKILIASNVDEWIKKAKLKEPLFNMSITDVGSLIVKYYIIIVFLKEASVRGGLTFLADMFDTLLQAVPNLIIGAGIILIAMIFADRVRKSAKKLVIPFNDTIAEAIYAIILFFGIVMALPKFGLTNTSLIEDSFKYIVLGISLGISLAIGIGFGWAIKEGPAKNLLKKKK